MTLALIQASASHLPLADESVQCVVTSPPYWGLRQYAGEQTVPEWGCALGLEPTPELYVCHIVAIFREVRRVLRKDGTLWLNLGDSYAGSGMGGNPAESAHRKQATNVGSLIKGHAPPPGLKPKDLVGIPWMVAFALRADGWYLRSDIIWHKPNPMPESVTDRPTKAHEYLFLLTKNERYFYDADAIREDARYGYSETVGVDGNGLYKAGVGDASRGPDRAARRVIPGEGGTRNKRTVWTIPTRPTPTWKKRSARQGQPGSGESSDGMTRTTSPTCPVHGSPDSPDPNGQDGGRAADDSIRTPRSDADPAQAPPLDSVPIDLTDDAGIAAGTTDSPRLGHVQTAIGRSNGTRKTGRVPATTPPYTPSVGTPARTERSEALPASVALGLDIPESSISEGYGAREPVIGEGRTSWNRFHMCTCSWDHDTGNTAHFATYPEQLVEPCILAGSRPGDTVLDPFNGSGTTGRVAIRHGRSYVGVDISREYLAEQSRQRIDTIQHVMSLDAAL